jgi:hypothetical protein
LLAAVDAVLHLARGHDGRRRIVGVGVLVANASGHAEVHPAYAFQVEAVVPGPGATALDQRLARAS